MAANTFLSISCDLTAKNAETVLTELTQKITDDSHIGYKIDNAFVKDDGTIQPATNGSYKWFTLNHISGSILQLFIINNDQLGFAYLPAGCLDQPYNEYKGRLFTEFQATIFLLEYNDDTVSQYIYLVLDANGQGFWSYRHVMVQGGSTTSEHVYFMGNYITDFCYQLTAQDPYASLLSAYWSKSAGSSWNTQSVKRYPLGVQTETVLEKAKLDTSFNIPMLTPCLILETSDKMTPFGYIDSSALCSLEGTITGPINQGNLLGTSINIDGTKLAIGWSPYNTPDSVPTI